MLLLMSVEEIKQGLVALSAPERGERSAFFSIFGSFPTRNIGSVQTPGSPTRTLPPRQNPNMATLLATQSN